MGSWGALQREGYERACAVVPGTEQALADALGGILAHPDQDTAWSFSSLTCSGAPVEMAFASYDPQPRYTVELGGPEIAPAERLSRINNFLAQHTEGSTIPAFEFSHTSPPQWGAWLGVRPGPIYKLYAETPDGAAPFGDYLETVPLNGRCVMVGQQPGSKRREFYFQSPTRGLTAGQIEQLLAHVGLAHRQTELTELMLACVFGGATSLPEVDYGFSYSVLPGAQQPVCSVFAHAADFIGGDGFVRHQLMSVAHARGWQLGSYPELSAPLSRQFSRAVYHNTIGFVVSCAPEIGLHVSVSPPPANQ
jgi:hypothetical protein